MTFLCQRFVYFYMRMSCGSRTALVFEVCRRMTPTVWLDDGSVGYGGSAVVPVVPSAACHWPPGGVLYNTSISNSIQLGSAPMGLPGAAGPHPELGSAA